MTPTPNQTELAERIAREIAAKFPQVENELSEQEAVSGIAAIIARHLTPAQPRGAWDAAIRVVGQVVLSHDDACSFDARDCKCGSFTAATKIRTALETARNAAPPQPALETALRDILASGVEHDDPRVSYITIQVDRVTWEAAREALSAPPLPVQWQPIESAPADESVFIYIPNAEHYGEGIYRAIFSSEFKSWTTFGLHIGRAVGTSYQPSLWLPLNALPPLPDPNKEQP